MKQFRSTFHINPTDLNILANICVGIQFQMCDYVCPFCNIIMTRNMQPLEREDQEISQIDKSNWTRRLYLFGNITFVHMSDCRHLRSGPSAGLRVPPKQ